ncbi:DUF2796 domain-containing protein [Anianabacter salinae]|uniref:DUF2796 domain-containing protein n=1 Tax=Anianabacter salinae TaxID=2851023 RepID=UPI00225DF09D|nr:DUF2796 domain-containing protein [Anianabacter salinae]MBV0913848.1 DUF2796 domain-containing protein [Anianabacter salinae]
MKTLGFTLLASVAAMPLVAQETRQMDAHVHGVSTLELAIEGNTVEINLLSPGMDIVGFEYAASTDADKDAVEAAIRMMLMPENVVTLPEAAECRLTEVVAHLHGGEHEHAEGEGHAHEEHAEDEDHKEDGGEHSEFHASYSFDCTHPEDLGSIGLPFFDSFANAEEIEAQYVTDAATGSAEITRDAPELTLN